MEGNLRRRYKANRAVHGGVKVAQADAKTAMILAFDVDMEGLAGYMSAPENAARIGAVTEGHTMYSLTKLPPPG